MLQSKMFDSERFPPGSSMTLCIQFRMETAAHGAACHLLSSCIFIHIQTEITRISTMKDCLPVWQKEAAVTSPGTHFSPSGSTSRFLLTMIMYIPKIHFNLMYYILGPKDFHNTQSIAAAHGAAHKKHKLLRTK